MSSTPIVVIVVLVVVIVLAAAAWMVIRRRNLQQRFGPEYDRAVSEGDGRLAAERELRARERRHAELDIKPLSAESRQQYATSWDEIQAQFVDEPNAAVGRADELVTRLIAERGYPTRDFEDRLADLSVEHADTLQHYRDAHAISERNTAGEASTEDLRMALVHYRALFGELLGTDPVPTTASTDSGPSTTDTAPSAPGPRTPVHDTHAPADSTAPDTTAARDTSAPDTTTRDTSR
jgi:hypothetical protein